jgi:hypothetical protein
MRETRNLRERVAIRLRRKTIYGIPDARLRVFTYARPPAASHTQTMAGAERDQKTVTGVRCGHCGAVIGVYEPMIVVRDGDAWETSRAAEPLPLHGAEFYHRDCFAEPADDAAV